MLREFIRHCLECFTLQTRSYLPYGSLQSIESPPVPFYILTLDFILALLLTSGGFIALMLVIYKFSKHIIFIEGIDTWFAKQLAHTFLKRLNLVN